ncbi:hypothetical protein D3C71_1443880 [compost metagenome]
MTISGSSRRQDNPPCSRRWKHSGSGSGSDRHRTLTGWYRASCAITISRPPSPHRSLPPLPVTTGRSGRSPMRKRFRIWKRGSTACAPLPATSITMPSAPAKPSGHGSSTPTPILPLWKGQSGRVPTSSGRCAANRASLATTGKGRRPCIMPGRSQGLSGARRKAGDGI